MSREICCCCVRRALEYKPVCPECVEDLEAAHQAYNQLLRQPFFRAMNMLEAAARIFRALAAGKKLK